LTEETPTDRRSSDGGGDVIDAVVAMFGFTSGAIG
jgi:hypothetical protein